MRQPHYPQLDENEFLSWEARQPGKFELHHGFVVAFVGGTADHDLISFNVRKALDGCYARPCVTFGSDLKVRVEGIGVFYCDAGVRCEPIDPGATWFETPRVVVEVLSASTKAYDLVEKRAAYRRLASLEHYVVVHTDGPRIEVDSRTTSGHWASATFETDAELGDVILRFDEVYADTMFADG